MLGRYEKLVYGIVQQAVEDYEGSVKRIDRLQRKRKKILSMGEFRPIKEGEPLLNYNRTKKRNTTEYVDGQIAESIEIHSKARDFILSPWFEEITNLDGLSVITKLDKELEEKGYKKTWD